MTNPALRKDTKKGSKLVFGSDGERVLDRGNHIIDTQCLATPMMYMIQ